VVGAAGCVLGVVVLAMPTTVIGNEFSKAFEDFKDQQKEQAERNARARTFALMAKTAGEGEVEEEEAEGTREEGEREAGGAEEHVHDEIELDHAAKKRFIVDMQLAINASREGMASDTIARMLGPEARQQLAKQELALALKSASTALQPPNCRLEWKTLGRAAIKRSLEDLPQLLASAYMDHDAMDADVAM